MQGMIRYVVNIYLNVRVRIYDNNWHILKRLIEGGNAKAIEQFLECNIDAHTRSHAHNPAYYDDVLRWSAHNEHIEIVNMLLERGVKVARCNNDALLHSIRNNHLEIVIALLKSSDQSSLNCALMTAAIKNNLEIVTVLLEHGADVRTFIENPLFASTHGYLIDNVNVSACDNRFLNRAFVFGHHEMIAKLLEHGLNIYTDDAMLLKALKRRFSERMADVMLPYCSVEDYQYFPDWYIKSKIVPTKGSNMCVHNG